MLMNGVLYFKEDLEPTDLLRSGLLASSVLEGIQLWRSGNLARARVLLRRGEEYLRVAAALSTGGFKTTAEGITSTEAFSRAVAACTLSLDMKAFGHLLEEHANRLRLAAEGRPVDLSEVEDMFSKIASQLVKDRFNDGSSPEKWRL